MKLLQSELLLRHGFAHGFSTRGGGVSAPPFDSLNLGSSVGDEEVAVAENRRRFAESVACPSDRLYEVHQVHGAEVYLVAEPTGRAEVAQVEADALVAAAPGLGVGVRVADCLPLLLADPGTGWVAAVHVGWRGAVQRIVHAAVERLRSARAAGRLLAVIGPHIRPAAFEVGTDVAAALVEASDGAPVATRGDEGLHVDLAEVVRAQLRAAGVGAADTDDVGGCTVSEPDRFFSHRRDRGRTGRQMGAIVARNREVGPG